MNSLQEQYTSFLRELLISKVNCVAASSSQRGLTCALQGTRADGSILAVLGCLSTTSSARLDWEFDSGKPEAAVASCTTTESFLQ